MGPASTQLPERHAAHDAGKPPQRTARPAKRARTRGPASLLAQGQPMIWLTGSSLAVCLVMITGLMGLVVVQGFRTFWPGPLIQVETVDGAVHLGELARTDEFRPGPDVLETLPADVRARLEADASRGELARRRLLRTGNYDISGEHFTWVSDHEIRTETQPEWAVVLERLTWGRFYGEPIGFSIDGQKVASEPQAVWELFEQHHATVRERWNERRDLEVHEIGALSYRQEQARLRARQAVLDSGEGSEAAQRAEQRFRDVETAAQAEFDRIRTEIDALNAENARFALTMRTASGEEHEVALAEVVIAYPANQLSLGDRLGVYGERWWEYLTHAPREANSEGGVFPAIFGTVMMTLIMTLLVVPFGVLAALYLREYAKAGPMISAVRIAVNNLAGVPSIVFGVFGLGFFCYFVGGSIDSLFFSSKLPSPTFGTGGILWASLTLALLTLPVVIVATEEALAAVPRSMREGSYACGASTWQTIRRIVLPRAMPGIMTGAILAMARGAGEVAPLMLVGAVKLAPELPFDGNFPFFHFERSFMHLGFHIYDLGFQSQNSEAAKPMVFTTTLLLILIIAFLNLAAVNLRSRLRRRFVANQF